MDVNFLNAFSASSGRPAALYLADSAMLSRGLEKVAGGAGGTFFEVRVGPDAAIDRLVRETSAYYLLSVEPLSTERDGKPHTITVKVKAPNATVRNRSFVVIPKAKGPVAPK